MAKHTHRQAETLLPFTFSSMQAVHMISLLQHYRVHYTLISDLLILQNNNNKKPLVFIHVHLVLTLIILNVHLLAQAFIS